MFPCHLCYYLSLSLSVSEINKTKLYFKRKNIYSDFEMKKACSGTIHFHYKH